MSSKIDFFASRERGARIAITMTKQAIIGCLKMKRGTAIASPIRYTRILPSVKPCFSALRKSSFCSSDSSSNVIPVLYGGSDNLATSPEKCKSYLFPNFASDIPQSVECFVQCVVLLREMQADIAVFWLFKEAGTWN